VSIAEPEADNRFLSEFLDDYFVECDEHLTLIRRNLLVLEGLVGASEIDRAPLDDLFRGFHTLKGISGMVGVRQAEELAHHVESYLRVLRDSRLTLSSEGMDALIAGTRLMEQVIAGRRSNAPALDIAPVLKRLVSVVSEVPSPAPQASGALTGASSAFNATETARLAAAVRAGKRIWLFEFVPLPELSQRGISVNIVRSRLQSFGELVRASPRVIPRGGIAFEFLVASDQDEEICASWADDGLSYRAYEGPAPIPESQNEEGSRAESLPEAPSLVTSNVVRVDLGRLDDLMRLVGELVISRSRLDQNLGRVEADLSSRQWRPLQEANLALERQLRDLRAGLMRVRMIPIGEIFERMKFVVRDLARDYQKKIKLKLSGEQTEIDKLLVERMMDPILHLVRNAVSHGLEPEEERLSLGKPAEGTITLRASAATEMVVIEIEDDGQGIDAEEVARRARAMGMPAAEAALDNQALLDLICAPGFSTRDAADRASGRGVGMNVVKNTILGLGGSLDLDTEPGRGTRFTIQLPLTLAIANALIVAVGDQRFAVPQASVREVVEVESSTVRAFENNEVIPYRGGVVPLLRLARIFRMNEVRRHHFHAFIIGSGLNSVAVAVDRILGQREIVVRPVNDPLLQVAGIAGATELGDGRIVLILDAAAISRSGRKGGKSEASSSDRRG
jgi:two-component system, chemotaxis family, sensor kinase CheA